MSGNSTHSSGGGKSGPAGKKLESKRPKSATFWPKKPYPDYLLPPTSGAWQKEINGRIYYFGRWGPIRNGKMERLPGDGWKDALALYKAQADNLHAGLEPDAIKDR